MNFTPEELRKLALPFAAAALLLAAGPVLIWGSAQSFAAAQRQLNAAQAERRQNGDRLARIAEEQREVSEKLDIYKQLKALNILGEERRLEWADAITRIRRERELLDVRYMVDRQRLLSSVAAKPGSVDFYASTMKVDLALLHEEDLVRFLADLRQSGNAFYSVKRCALARTGEAGGAATLAPRLRADCDIDLVTIQDRGAKDAMAKK